MHTNCISKSAMLHNNYILLLSDLCACVHVKKKWHHKGSHSSSVSGSNTTYVTLQACKKAMSWCTAQWKMLLFCVKTIVNKSCKFELACMKKKKNKKKTVWGLFGSVLLRCFLVLLGVFFVMKIQSVDQTDRERVKIEHPSLNNN